MIITRFRHLCYMLLVSGVTPLGVGVGLGLAVSAADNSHYLVVGIMQVVTALIIIINKLFI